MRKLNTHYVLMVRIVFIFLVSFSPLLLAQPTLLELQRAANEGDPWAQLNLAAAYDNGFAGAAKDPVVAVKWYRRSAEQGVVKAQFNLAHCLGTGYGTAQDLVGSRHWMLLAAQQGMADAQYLLGVMLADGLGGAVDLGAARFWLHKAVDGGNKDAAEHLKTLN